ncbi:8-oxo-dGTP diphosphatase [Haloimpatiens sp. FM7315]|uniref:8-oxo-dGTP diphosphatase n=1 Tax=Haloimpatiens sp. FM7315 TaxID=3298609 RepID=UPI00370C806F
MENIELTNMCMIEDTIKGKVLVQNRVNESWKGIAFPGGHIEKGESIVESVLREVKEETNLDIDDVKLCGIKNWYTRSSNKRYIVFLFKTHKFFGRLLENGEEGEVYWVDKKSIYTLDLAEGFNKMLDVMLSESLNEHFIRQDMSKDTWYDEIR